MDAARPDHDRSRATTAAAAGAAAVLALQAVAAWLPALEYRRELLTTQPWRLLSGHFVHVNWTHAAVNAAAWILLARLFGSQLDGRRQWLTVLAAGLFISLALAIAFPQIAWYRGASGVLHALFFAGATGAVAGAVRERSWRQALLPAALFVGGWIKVAFEQPAGADTPFAPWLGVPVVPQAHLLGAAFGTLFGPLLARRPSRPPLSA